MAEESLSMTNAPAAVRTRGTSSASPRPAPPWSPVRDLGERHLLLPLASGLVFLVFLVLAIGGYAWGWKWTGFSGNTLWDWINLLVTPLTIGIATIVFSVRQAHRTQAITLQQHQEVVLDAYLDTITHLLVNSRLREEPAGSPVREVARVRTRATVQRVGNHQREVMLRFLTDFGLLSGSTPLLTADEVDDFFADTPA